MIIIILGKKRTREKDKNKESADLGNKSFHMRLVLIVNFKGMKLK